MQTLGQCTSYSCPFWILDKGGWNDASCLKLTCLISEQSTRSSYIFSMSSLQSAADYLMSQSRATPRITQWRGPISLSKSGKEILSSKGDKRTYGPNIVEFRASWFAIDGTLVQFAVLPRCRVDCVDVDHRHLLVQYLWSGLWLWQGWWWGRAPWVCSRPTFRSCDRGRRPRGRARARKPPLEESRGCLPCWTWRRESWGRCFMIVSLIHLVTRFWQMTLSRAQPLWARVTSCRIAVKNP